MVYKWFVTAQQIQPDTDLVVEIDLIMGKITLLCSCSPHTLSMTKSICCSVFLIMSFMNLIALWENEWPWWCCAS